MNKADLVLKNEFLKEKITNRLFNDKKDLKSPEEQKTFFEQYKLIIDTTQKNEERRTFINNIFIILNSSFMTIIIQLFPFYNFQAEKALLLLFLLPVGIILSWDWIRIITSFQKINYINQSLIEVTEENCPIKIFTLRSELIDESKDPSQKANLIANKEKLIPKIFLTMYLIYFSIALLSILFPF